LTDAQFPAPLVAAEVDLRDFQYMELDVRVLRDSRFAAQVSGDAFRAGVLLWCAAWHQVPCGSLPDDDIELANLAGYGRFIKEWRKVRDEALLGFVLCSDGRLYHELVCMKASQGWTSKLRHHYDRACDRLRKANKAAQLKGLPESRQLSFDEWNARRIEDGAPVEKSEASAGNSPNPPTEKNGFPAENALRGNGTERNGTERRGNGEGDSLFFADDLAPGPEDPPGDAPPPEPPAAPAPATRSARAPKAKAEPPPTAATWVAYATAYMDRYGTPPVRNAKVNGQLALLVGRLGLEEAPRVAAFFVGHQRVDYVRATHPIDLLLRDAEGLRTQWAKGTQTTHAQATMADRTQTNANAFGGLLAEATARQAQEKT
jgi:hypothetical protein